MNFLFEFNDFKERESKTRTKPLSDEEFLEIVKNNCKIFHLAMINYGEELMTILESLVFI